MKETGCLVLYSSVGENVICIKVNETAPFLGGGKTSDYKLFLKILLQFNLRKGARGKGILSPCLHTLLSAYFPRKGRGCGRKGEGKESWKGIGEKAGFERGKRSGNENGNENGMGLRKRSVKGEGKMVRGE
jgi:hypothetical protein